VAEDLSDDQIVKALGHPARREILRIFDEGIASPKEIAARVGLPLPNVSYHVKILRELGLIELQRTTPRRGAVEHHYMVRPRPALTPRAAASLPSSAKSSLARAAWRTIADTAPDTLVQARELRLDAKGEAAAVEALEAFWTKLDKIEEASGKRAGRAADESPEMVVGLVFGKAASKAPAKPASRAVGKASSKPKKVAKK